MATTRRLAAILAADVAGYSRLMAADEVGTLAALKAARREVVDPAIAEHNGRIVKTTGDGMLLEFASAVDAVTCAMAVQEKMAARGGSLAFRIGINVGDIIIDSDDIFGDGVNVAARVENECEPGGVCLSDDAFRQLRAKTSFTFDDLGERTLKNLDRLIRIYAVRRDGAAATTASIPEPTKPLPLPDKPSIAVLPFQNMSGDPEQEYFADGMVEDIITALSRFKSLFVIARNSSFTYKGKAVDIKQVGRELGVRYVLEGSVRKAGGRIRITGQLIEAASNQHLWADKFDGASGDVFDLQDKVTSSVVGIIAPRIQRAEIERSRAKPTSNLEAYDWYLRGLAAADRFGRDQSEEAIRMFKTAIELDPEFAIAMACISFCYGGMALQGWLDDEGAAEAIKYLQLAQERGGNDADVLALCAATMNIGMFNADLDVANLLAERAVSLNPNIALGWSASGFLKRALGNHKVAIEHFSRALQLNPFDSFNVVVVTGSGWANFLLKQYDDSWRAVRSALADNKNYLPALRLSAALYSAQGQRDLARKTADRILELNPDEKISAVNVVRYNRRAEDRAMTAHFLRLAGLPE
jgi:TolB-like protein/class 3 adenylate cyclase